MNPIRTLTSRTVVLPIDNIDTDIIIPARFLKVTEKTGLGRHLFAGWRYGENDAPRPGFVLNRPEASGAAVLVAGDNFGCGSSREHAPWALADFGFRAVISTSFASIFRNNALKNGLLPIEVPAAFQAGLAAAGGGDPQSGWTGPTVTVDLEACTVTGPDGARVTFPIDPFPRYCLLNGLDELSFLLREEQAISDYERRAGAGPSRRG